MFSRKLVVFWLLSFFIPIVLTGCGGGGEVAVIAAVLKNVSNNNGDNTPKLGKVFVEQTSPTTAKVTWQAATGSPTPQEQMGYEIHVAETSGFTPSNATRRTTVFGVTEAEITGLETGKIYYVLVIAVSKQGYRSEDREYKIVMMSDSNTPSQKIIHVTDVKTDIGLILRRSDQSEELITIHGKKDAQGHLISVTDVMHSITSSKSVYYHLNADSLEVIFIKPGKKYKLTIKNYNSIQKTADMSFTEQENNGSEILITQATNVPVPNGLPIKDSGLGLTKFAFSYDVTTCFKNKNCDPSEWVSVCLWNWANDLINQIMTMFCNAPVSSFASDISTILVDFGNGLEGRKGKLCAPYVVPGENCPSSPVEDFSEINDLNDFTSFGECLIGRGKKLEVCLDLLSGFMNNMMDTVDEVKRLAQCKPAKSTPIEQCTPIRPKIPKGPRAGVKGDPHFYTFDRMRLDFQAVGEFIFVKSIVPNDPFEIQVRLSPFEGRTDVSIIRAVAMNVGGERVGLYPSQKPSVYVNGIPTELSNASLLLPHGGRITLIGSSYSVGWPNGDGLVELGGSFLTTYLGEARKGKVTGILGNADDDYKNEITMRNGTNLGININFSTLYPSYADSWRISQAESLFDYAPGESTSTFTIRNFPRTHARVSDLDPAVRAAAEKTCRAAGITAQICLDDCILDVALTNDPNFAISLGDFECPQNSADIAPPPPPTFGTAGFGQFRGTVSDATNKQVINAAQVKLSINRLPLLGTGTKSTTNGIYQTDVISMGSGYHLDIQANGYIAEEVFGLTASDRVISEVEPIKLVPASLDGKSGIVTGKARNALDNNPMANLTVEVRRYINNRQGDPIQVTKTDGNGEFHLGGLNSGNYTLALFANGVMTNYFTATSIADQSTFIDAVINPDMGNALYRVILNWVDSSDLDAHLTGPDTQGGRFHIYFNVPGSNAQIPYAQIDRDDKDGQGPETVSIYKLQNGVYRYSVHDYKNSASTSSQVLGNSGAKVSVYGRTGLLASYFVPNQEGTLWTVFEMDENGAITPVNQMGYEVSQGTIPSAIGTKSILHSHPRATDYGSIVFQTKKQ